MRPSLKSAMVDAAIRVLRNSQGIDLTLEAVAEEAGVTKGGIMYHFPSRDALIMGVVERVAEEWNSAFTTELGKPLEESTPYERLRAYVTVVATLPPDRADFAVFAETVNRPALAEPWTVMFEKWFRMPDDMPVEEVARLAIARVAVDGFWTGRLAAGGMPESPPRVAAMVEQLLRMTEPPAETTETTR